MKKLLTLFLLLTPLAHGQLWSGLLSPNRAVDWTGAGATIPTGTIPNCPTQPASYTAAGINTAISANLGAAAYCLVNIPAGTYNITDTILFNHSGIGNVILNGAGSNLTFLNWTSTPSGQCIGFNATNICAYNGDNSINAGGLSWANNAAISSGYSQGSTTLVLANHTNLKVGSLIQIAQNDLTSDNGNAYFCQSTNGQGSSPFCSQQGTSSAPLTPSAASETQMVTVTACGTSTLQVPCTSNTVTITPGVYAPNWVAGQSPKAWWQSTFPLYNVGVQNLSVDVSAITAGTIWETLAASNVWFKNVRSINGTVAGKAATNHFQIYGSSHVTVEFSYMYGANPQFNGYGVDFGGGTSDSLALSNITQHMPSGLMGETAVADVFAYNYSVDNFFGSQFQQCDEFEHSAGDYYNLFEGNVGICATADDIHGTHFAVTRFRNYLRGYDPATEGGAYTDNIIAINDMAYSRYFNDVANVLGISGKNSTYQYAMSSSTDCGPGNTGYVYVMGDSDQNITTWTASGSGGCYPGGFLINSDLDVASSLMRWGNWDPDTNAVRFCTANATPIAACTADERGDGASTYPGLSSPSTTFPASFYFASQPSWWVFPSGTSSPWPGIGPDVTGGDISGTGGHANLNPAANCYLNIMGGLTNGSSGPLTFNPAACYTASSTPAPGNGFLLAQPN